MSMYLGLLNLDLKYMLQKWLMQCFSYFHTVYGLSSKIHKEIIDIMKSSKFDCEFIEPPLVYQKYNKKIKGGDQRMTRKKMAITPVNSYHLCSVFFIEISNSHCFDGMFLLHLI